MKGIIEGNYRLWLGTESAILTEFQQYPRKNVVNFFLVGGNLSECLLMEDQINQWAKDMKANRVMAVGRHGWKKPLAQKGWKAVATVYMKDI